MKIQQEAANVYKKTALFLKNRVINKKPVWFDVVGAYPPETDLTKKPFSIINKDKPDFTDLFNKKKENGFYKTRNSKSDRIQKNNFTIKIPKLLFFEDELRDFFYHQHPWELSNPKSLVENLGDDNSHCDWSHILQLNKPLDGESVVQRTLWLLNNTKNKSKPLTLHEAYDLSRFEFYKLRIEEELDSAISKEESTMYGSLYKFSFIEHGLKHEQICIDKWIVNLKDKLMKMNFDSKNSNNQDDDLFNEDNDHIWKSIDSLPNSQSEKHE